MTTFNAKGLPTFEVTDKIAASGDGLREDLNLLSASIGMEGDRAESAAKADADGKFGTILGPKVVALDTDGTPYYTTTGATLRIFPDTDGNPYYADDPWPVVTTDTDGVPYLTY